MVGRSLKKTKRAGLARGRGGIHVANRCLLLVLDGWGHADTSEHNAIAQAQTPLWDALWNEHPHSLLTASGAAVGLPDGQMGNSEVGHSTLGAGRVLWQSLARLDHAVAQGELQQNRQLIELMGGVKQSGKRLHLFGLLSDGGVHSHENHLHALVQMARQVGLKDLAVHAILDGRDVLPRSAATPLKRMEDALARTGYTPIADITGRYWAMDRDNRWERTTRAMALYCRGEAGAPKHKSALAALAAAYARDESDEFVAPTVVHPALVRDGDALLFANFRADRMRQLVQGFCSDDAAQQCGLKGDRPHPADILTMTEYQPDLPVRVAFTTEKVPEGLGEVLANGGHRQLRIAETEKFAHVTYFFSCGQNQPFDGEKRILIPSEKVATYDLKPQMSAPAITDEVEREIAEGDWRFGLCNFANGDMVGHTGNMKATIAAVECLDTCMGRILRAATKHNVHLCITADHGNCEQMYDSGSEQSHTAHTLNPVPFVYRGEREVRLEATGGLADVAPTLMELMDVPVPKAMSGRSLLKN